MGFRSFHDTLIISWLSMLWERSHWAVSLPFTCCISLIFKHLPTDSLWAHKMRVCEGGKWNHGSGPPFLTSTNNRQLYLRKKNNQSLGPKEFSSNFKKGGKKSPEKDECGWNGDRPLLIHFVVGKTGRWHEEKKNIARMLEEHIITVPKDYIMWILRSF